MVGDAPCEELKGCISRCRFLVAARTHASIAAYSTGVPTLVAGYSVKARGIARDLFGTEDGHVLPVQAMDDPIAHAEAEQLFARDRAGLSCGQAEEGLWQPSSRNHALSYRQRAPIRVTRSGACG